MAAVLALAGPAVAYCVDPPHSARAQHGLPSLAELERVHARIGRIDVYVANIFDLDDPRENKALYRLADRWHYKTREQTVRKQLIFASGQILSVATLEEAERILRSRPYLNDAWIVPVAWDPVNGVVDLAVTVRDVWTLDPVISGGHSGGRTQTGAGISENNLLGLGTTLTASRLQTIDRSSTVVSYADNNLADSWWQLGLSYADSSDGSTRSASLQQPFYSLDSVAAGGATGTTNRSTVSLYSGGQIRDQFEETHNQGQLYIGGSAGLVDGWTRRWYAGVRYDAADFAALPGALSTGSLPADRTFAYPWMGWQVLEDRYVKAENLDLIGRTEDQYLGRSLYAEMGYSAPAFGGVGRSWLTQATATDGWSSADRRYLFISAAVAGRVDDGAVHNLNITATGRYFERISDQQLIYASLSGTASHRLDGEQQLDLGADTGLRGYPVRFQSGTASALLTLEHRFYTSWYPLRILRVGTVVFFDAGRTWGRDFTGAEPLGLLRDIGLGLRLGNNRSSLGNVVHLDVSYALDAPAGIRRLEYTVSTSQRF